MGSEIKVAKLPGFVEIWESLRRGFQNVMNFEFYKDNSLSTYWDMAKKAMSNVGEWLPYVVLLVLSLLLCFFGKKMMGFLKVVAFLGIGYAFGGVTLPALIGAESVSKAPVPLIFAIVVAVLAALLSKFLYCIGMACLLGYTAYFAGYTYSVTLKIVKAGEMQMVAGLVCAAVVILLFFLLRKFWERLLTAVGGAWLSMLCIKGIYDFTAVPFLKQLGGFEQTFLRPDAIVFVSELIVAGVIAIIGFIIQIQTRKRYY